MFIKIFILVFMAGNVFGSEFQELTSEESSDRDSLSQKKSLEQQTFLQNLNELLALRQKTYLFESPEFREVMAMANPVEKKIHENNELWDIKERLYPYQRYGNFMDKVLVIKECIQKDKKLIENSDFKQLVVEGMYHNICQTEVALYAYKRFDKFSSAFELLESISDNHPQARLDMAIMLGKGEGCTADYSTAVKLLQEMADDEHFPHMLRAQAEISLGANYELARFGVEKDLDKALMHYRRAEEHGCVRGAESNILPILRGRYEIALDYQKGTKSILVDLPKALELLQQLDKEGYAPAQIRLAQMYERKYHEKLESLEICVPSEKHQHQKRVFATLEECEAAWPDLAEAADLYARAEKSGCKESKEKGFALYDDLEAEIDRLKKEEVDDEK